MKVAEYLKTLTEEVRALSDIVSDENSGINDEASEKLIDLGFRLSKLEAELLNLDVSN